MSENTNTNAAATAPNPAKVEASTKLTGKQVSAVLTPAEFAALREYRFDNRIERTSDIVRKAILELIGFKG